MKALGIDIGGSGIKAAPVDTRKGTLLAPRFRIATPQPATPAAVAEVVGQITTHFAWDGLVGCAFPARVRRNTVETASNIDASWIGTNAAKLFRKASGCKTVVLNDADAAGVAEITFGNGRKQKGLVLMLTVGTGIGSALFVDGTLVPNLELGHLPLKNMPAEHYASDRVRKTEKLTWERWTRRFQRYLSLIEFLIAPDMILIGGGVSRPKKWERVQARLATRAVLAPAKLENEAGIIGAARAAVDRKG